MGIWQHNITKSVKLRITNSIYKCVGFVVSNNKDCQKKCTVSNFVVDHLYKNMYI